jgi:GTP diphosphokinase / guanosine-3',5'-bis(diphosphate) 3'-diphosphatase
LLPEYEVASKDELYSKIGSGLVTLEDLKKILRKNTKSKWIKFWDLSLAKTAFTKPKEEPTPDTKGAFIAHEGFDDDEKNYVLAKCCNPIPGDEVIGYKDEFDTVTIHQAGCDEAVKLSSRQGNRVIPVTWTKHKVLAYLVTIAINGFDRFGVYNNITTVISKELSVNIRTINLHGHDGIFEGTIELYVHNTADLNNLILNLIKIKGVESVHRVEGKE